MKRTLTFLMTALFLCVGMTVKAQVTIESPWAGSAIEDGQTYYLYNVKANAFLKGANDWGTQASFGEDAVAFTAEGSGDTYGLKSLTYGDGKYLGNGLYVDQAKKEFVFAQVGDGIYTIAKDGAFLAYNGNSVVKTVAEVTDGCYWQLLTKESILADMAAAAAGNPYAVTALIPGANFCRENHVANSAWTGGPGLDGDVDNFCAEKWNAGISSVTQTLTGLPNGTYKLQAQGLYRMGGVGDAVALRDAGTEVYDVYFIANDSKVLVMSVMDEAGKLNGVGDNYGTYGAAPNNRNHASKFFNAGYYEHELYFTVTDGTAVIGVANNTGAGADWLVFDNFRLTYYGTATVEEIEQAKLGEFFTEVEDLIAAAEAIEATYSAEAKAELEAAIATGKAAMEALTKEALVAAVAPLQTAIARAERSVALNAIDFTSATWESPIDMTQFVANPDMETGNIDGWTTTSGWQFQSNNEFANGDAVINRAFQERWMHAAALGNTSTEQTLLDMPNGWYSITVSIIATRQDAANPKEAATGVYLFAGDEKVAAATENNTPENFTVKVQIENNELTFGIKGENAEANWIAFDNVKLSYCGNAEEPEQPVVDPNDYTSYIINADLATGDAWNTEGTKGIANGYVKVGSGSIFDFCQTITLPAGQYKMTAKAAYRYGGDGQAEYDAIQAGTDTHLAKLYAATATYKYEGNVMNRYEGASETDLTGGRYTTDVVNNLYVPNASDAVKVWFDNDQYVNELVFNVQEDGEVKIGIANAATSPIGDYTNIGAWTLTRLGDAEADPQPEPGEPEEPKTDYTDAIVNADLSTADAWNTEGTKGIANGYVKVGSGSIFDFCQTITLPAGQYKMTAKAAYRYGGDGQTEYDAIQAGTDTHLAKLYAATATYKYEGNVMNRYEGASETDLTGGKYTTDVVNNLYVPNASDAVKVWFDNDQYVNELVFNVQEDGEVKIGIANAATSPIGDYTNIGAWTLTRLGDAEADPEIEEPTPDPDPTPDPEETIDMDLTHLVGTSRDAWIGNNGGPVNIDGISLPEKYETTTATLGDVMWQTVTGLENGKYTVELWANARYTSGRGFNSDAADGALDFTYLYANNVEISIEVYHNGDLNNGKSYKLEGVEVTDGTLKMGMTKKAAGSNWHTIQIKSLIYHAPANAALDMAKVDLQAALDAANAVEPKKDDFVAAIAAAQGVYDNSKSVEEIEAATATLLEATKLAILGNASPSNPVLTDFVVNGTFDASTAPWQSTTGAQNQALASNQQGAFTGNFFENWNPNNYTGKLYQVIENIPNGVYELSICAFVETFDASAQFVYANADKVALTTGVPTAYTVRTIVKNNTIEVGFEQTAAVNRWCGIDNVSLTYFGEASDEESLNAAKVAFTAAYEEFGAALTACQAMMLKMSFYEIDDAAYQLNEQLETTTDVDALNAMAETLAEATASLKEINEVYAGYDVFVQKFKAASEISMPTTQEAADLLEFNMYGGAGMQATSLEALAQAVETIKADYFTYIANAKLLDGNMFDLTYLIQNPNIDHNLDGWTLTGRVGRLNNNGFNGVPGIMEIGEWGATSWEAGVSQNLNELPNGKYIVKMAWMAASGIKMNLSANEASVEVVGIGDQGGNIAADGSVVEMGQGVQGWQYAEVEVFVEDGTLAIAVNSSSAAQYQWSNADQFQLYYAGVPSPVEPEYLTVVGAKVGDVAIVEGVATVESISTIDIIFDRPVAKAEDAGWATLADSYGPTNLDVEVLEAEEGSSEYVVRFSVSQEFNGEFTDAGEYTLNIPEGFIVGAEDANYINAAIAATITIEAAPATPLTVTNVTVGEDVMEGFTVVATPEDMIKVNFDGQFYFQGMPSIVDAEGNDASEYFQWMNGIDVDGSNSYIFMAQNWQGTVAPAGVYTITLAKASFMEMMSYKAPAEDIVLTVEITFPDGIQNIEVDADAVIYDLSGRRVTKMTKGVYIVNGKKVIKK